MKEMAPDPRECRDFCDSANDLMQSVTPDGYFRYVNNAWLRTLGYTRKKASQMTIFDIIHPAEQAHCRELFRKVMCGEAVGLVETTLVARDGREVPVEGNVNYRFAEGKPVYARAVLRDVTERKKKKAELEWSREFFRTVFDSISDAVSIINVADFTIAAANECFLRKYGLKETDVIGRACYELTHRRSAPCIPPDDLCPLSEATASGKSAVVEHVHYDSNGKKSYVEVSVFPVRDTDGRVVQTVHVARDITERKQAEEELRKFRTITEKAGYRIAIIDLERNNIVYANKAFTAMHGYEGDQLLGRHYSMLFTSEQLKEIERLKVGTLKGGDSGTAEVWRKKKDGTLFPSLTRSIAVKDEVGNPLFIAATVIDITERKRTEDALRESEERYRTLIEMSSEIGEAVVMLQDVGGKAGVHTFVTDEWSRITGYSREELLAMSWFDLLHPDHRSGALARYRRRFHGEVILDLVEAPVIRKDGAPVPIEILAAATTYRENPALVVFARDITERKQAAEEREKLIRELRKALSEVKILSGLLPVCAWCKKLRDDAGYWKSVEEYLGERTDAEFTHGICPDCQAKVLEKEGDGGPDG